MTYEPLITPDDVTYLGEKVRECFGLVRWNVKPMSVRVSLYVYTDLDDAKARKARLRKILKEENEYLDEVVRICCREK